MRRLLALSAVLCAAGLAACGDDGGETGTSGAVDPSGTPAPRTTPQTPGPGTAPSPPAGDPLALPPGVPTTPVRDRTSDEDRRVIQGWLRALSAGDIAGAASFFAQPSRVQNGTPVITLRSAADRAAFNFALPCGAQGVRLGSRDGYTVVEFRLTDRPGGDCGAATGQGARGAIRVDDGKITEWYRLPDDPGAAPSEPVPQIEGDTTDA